jgi:hypothetical protein
MKRHRLLSALPVLLGFALPLVAGASGSLEADFRNPPHSAQPKTLWFWMNGNVTKDGITRDLEAMRRVGVGGVLLFDGGPYQPAGPAGYLNPLWRELMTHTLQEGRRLGVDIGMHNGPGWSSSGGPWITPERSMQQLVWTEATVRGPQRLDLALPPPQKNEGYYRDACVLAFPAPSGEETAYEDELAKITTGTGRIVDKAVLSDGRLDTAVAVSPEDYLQFEFLHPIEVQAISANSTVPNEARAVTATSALLGHFPALQIEASMDGKHYAPLCDVRSPGRQGIQAPGVRSFPAVRARYFRVRPAQRGELSEVVFQRSRRLEDWVFKANFGYRVGRQVTLPAPGDRAGAIDPASVLDLTASLDAEGRLHWDAPAGAWTILRIGQTSTGRTNVSASAAGTGLETDKLSRDATDFHFAHVVGQVLADAGPEAAAAMTSLSIDSYEAGMQNWTAAFPAEFQRRTGYDLRPYLPAMTGRIVGDTAISERFLYDVRRVQADLMAENYYGRLAGLCRERGLTFYTEGYGQGVFDEMHVSGLPDVPMSEFWVRNPWAPNRTVKMVSSAAHVYGKPVVAAEAFTGEEQTSRWLEYPYAMKVLGDDMLAQGVNQMVFHRYAHQPHPTAVPGMAMGPWGFFFERTNTWFEQSGEWLRYLARSQQLLRQGTYVADVLSFVGERPPNNAQFAIPVLPRGFNYDLVTAEVLLNRVTMQDGCLTLPEGARYRVLMLPPDLKAMTPELMHKLRTLVEQGAVVLGPKPEYSPTLRGYPASDAAMRREAAALWDEGKTGAGRIHATGTIADVIRDLKLEPDFDYTGARADAELSWLHRRLPDGDLYFVANRERLPVDVLGTFRVAGREPELWNPETGATTPVVLYTADGDRTRVPLRLGPAESVFVIFRRPAAAGEAWLAKDGRRIEDATTMAPAPASAVTNTFTMAVWAKPDIDLRLMPAESVAGKLDETGKSYVIAAAEGDVLHGAGHAIAGLAVGRNGVYVVERGRAQAPAVLVERRPIAGWTHVAIVYRDGRPRLYLDGKFVREGLVSGAVVHPGVGSPPPFPGTIYHFTALENVVKASGLPLPPSLGRAFLFEGSLTTPELFPEALSDDAIARLAARGLPPPPEPPAVELAVRDDGRVEGVFWQSGTYALASGRSAAVTVAAPVTLAGPWPVAFQPGRGAPAEIVLPELQSWHRHADPGVRHFSGTAACTRVLDVPADFLGAGKRVVLDLGRVEVVAQVRVNGRAFAPLWMEPYRIDITDAVHAGANALEIRVTNLWANRLIGDEALPAENDYESAGEQHGIRRLPDWYAQNEPKPAGGRTTFSTWQFFKSGEPLLESGLLGPVRLLNPVDATFAP